MALCDRQEYGYQLLEKVQKDKIKLHIRFPAGKEAQPEVPVTKDAPFPN